MIRVLREIHEVPASIQGRVARAGGLNRFGEPNFRVVWGGSRLAWIGGRWTDRDTHGNVIREAIELRRVPKYVPTDRWHIERWTPPESYGWPDLWYEQTIEVEDGIRVPALGPYPSRGDYEHCFILEGPRGDFVQLTPAAARHIARAIEASRVAPRAKGREALENHARRQEREYDSYADAVLS